MDDYITDPSFEETEKSCPSCGSTDIEDISFNTLGGGPYDSDFGAVVQYRCRNCGREGTDDFDNYEYLNIDVGPSE